MWYCPRATRGAISAHWPPIKSPVVTVNLPEHLVWTTCLISLTLLSLLYLAIFAKIDKNLHFHAVLDGHCLFGVAVQSAQTQIFALNWNRSP